MENIRIAFFGTPQIAVWVLEELTKAGIKPALVITNPDRPSGRKMAPTPPPVKTWADINLVPVRQPESPTDPKLFEDLKRFQCNLFVVVAYGRILPKEILDIPEHGVLNVHPSLLPELRGASPIRSAVLKDMKDTGVTIMQMDEEMDHGPIVAQEEVSIPSEEWPIRGSLLDEELARVGGKLLAAVIPDWIAGKITPTPQNHKDATYCTKIQKADGEINLGDDPYQNFLKICAFDGWPGTFFFTKIDGKDIRVKIVDAIIDDSNALEILRVIPEGKREMSYDDFLRSV